MSRPTPVKIDTYQAFEILAEARSGARELGKVREMLSGEREWGAQVRLLIALARRGHVDINSLVKGK
ncbi:MAG TPA: hypothetical protein VHW01_04855 [Polyangiaceae bacterium]|jgi:hypothetical protein|nr:hypothetical protein [Polyangiaceae bacterium]